MKAMLTAEESAKLIELGVSPERASERTPDYTDINDTGRPLERRELLPIFTLADLIGILSKEIDYNGLTYGLNMWVDSAIWYVEYVAEARFGQFDALNADNFESPELIDALYSLLVWCLEKGHVKVD